ALLSAMPSAKRRDYLTRTQSDGRTRLDRLVGGELDRGAGQICGEGAGPYDVEWDGKLASSLPRLRGRIPAAAQAGEGPGGGAGGGTRTKRRGGEEDAGVLRGGEVPGGGGAPPSEVFGLPTSGLPETLYPGETPPLPGA